MKNKARQIIDSIAVLLTCTLLCSLVFGLLYYFAKISTNTFHIWNWICGILAFSLAGFILGKRINKKALLHAFSIVVILALIMFLLSGFSIMTTIEIVSKCFAYIISCIVAFNMFHKSL